MRASIVYPPMPKVSRLATLVLAATEAVVGTFRQNGEEITIFSDSRARDSYCAHVNPQLTVKGSFYAKTNKGERVKVAWASK